MIYFKLFLAFFKIGIFSFGGGYAMLPLIEKQVIYQNNWIDYEGFIDIIATSQMTPGPIAINSATFIGYKIGGVLGSIVSTMGVVLAPTIMILILSKYLLQFNKSKTVQSIFEGLRPALIGLILASAYSVGKTSIFDYTTFLIVTLMLIIINKTKIHPIATIFVSACLGVFFYI
ncbi:chromate transporter [Anaerovirgula multivorans]|uniref:Chromate transporter n=1 Tax=Anaerovirgula multivorans TaxID=312168 RepID=A0A239E891_9FIRM|nr:chromate transporter [Anaerovirgula multivorans]SNS40970.1 chromate transporter [Anaerovirgula multivorans]